MTRQSFYRRLRKSTAEWRVGIPIGQIRTIHGACPIAEIFEIRDNMDVFEHDNNPLSRNDTKIITRAADLSKRYINRKNFDSYKGEVTKRQVLACRETMLRILNLSEINEKST